MTSVIGGVPTIDRVTVMTRVVSEGLCDVTSVGAPGGTG